VVPSSHLRAGTLAARAHLAYGRGMRTENTSQTRSEDERAIAVVEEFFAAMAAKDTDRVFGLLAEDVVYQNVPFPAARGKAAVVRTLKGFERFMTGFEVQMKNIAARNGVVLTERVDILKGPLLYLDIWVCGTFEVKDGKITLWRDYFDLAEATAKLALGPVRSLLRR
jgi:limonene-1,2-epoxide hydrolase